MVRHANYWFESCPTKRQIASGLVRNADILIIGGGIAGISLLYQLVSAGISNVYLVEENTIGYRASGRSSGQLLLRGSKLFSEMPEQDALEYLRFVTENNRRFINGLRNAKFDSDLRETGGLRLAVSDSELDKLKNEASFINFTCPMFSSQQLEPIFPGSKFLGAMFVPNEAIFNPYKVVNGLRELVEQNGTRVITDAQVDKVVTNEDSSFAVSIRHRGTIRAKQLVYCTNAYSSELLPELHNKLFTFRGQMMATDILPDDILKLIPAMSLTCNNCNEYFRLHGGRLLVGGMRHAVRGQQEDIIDDGEISPAVYERLRYFVNSYMPFMKNTKFTHSWSGIMCRASDGLPLIGAIPNTKNQFIMTGFNGYGYSHVFMGGLIIKDYLLQGKSDHIGTRLFDPRRL